MAQPCQSAWGVCGLRAVPILRSNPPRTKWRTRAAARQGQHGQKALPPLRAWPATARVALRTGVYIAALGSAVFLLPGHAFGALFDASLVSEGWVRVGGVLAALFGAYYLGAALDDAAGRFPQYFYVSTIAGRLLLSTAFAGLVAARQCEPALLWLAAANAASSVLLLQALRRRAASGSQAA